MAYYEQDLSCISPVAERASINKYYHYYYYDDDDDDDKEKRKEKCPISQYTEVERPQAPLAGMPSIYKIISQVVKPGFRFRLSSSFFFWFVQSQMAVLSLGRMRY